MKRKIKGKEIIENEMKWKKENERKKLTLKNERKGKKKFYEMKRKEIKRN